MLNNDRGIRNQGPEFIRLETRVALQVVEEGLFIGVVVWIWLQ